MSKQIAVIVNPERPSYDRSYAEDSAGKCYQFVTNFDINNLPDYINAIDKYEGPIEFGICETAYGFYEDEGISFDLPNHNALYMNNIPEEGTHDFFKWLNI